MYIIYSVINPSGQVYYGYAQGNDIDDAKKSFLANAHRPDQNRVDVKYFGDIEPDQLLVEVVDVADSEEEAHLFRNEHRVSNDSVSRPTNFPANINRKAEQQFPERVAALKEKAKLMSLPTARKAWAAGLYNKDQIANLTITHPKTRVIADLDNLTPAAFNSKYFGVAA